MAGLDVVEHQSVMHKIKHNRMVLTACRVRQATTSHRPVMTAVQLPVGD
jgi:hypothetical protein